MWLSAGMLQCLRKKQKREIASVESTKEKATAFLFRETEVKDNTISVGQTRETSKTISEVQKELINSSETSSTIKDHDDDDEEYIPEEGEINSVRRTQRNPNRNNLMTIIYTCVD
ncbi:hypothetical protein Trydic_g1980 [Trypoxylus dichotomus]